VIETVLQQLIAEDLLSDSRYAEIYALSRVDKGYGPWRIRRELSEHGVSEDIITTVLKNFDNDWMAKLAALHRKRFAALPLTIAPGRLHRFVFCGNGVLPWSRLTVCFRA